MNNLIGKNLTAGYGGVDIIKDINLEVNEGEIVVIVGPNGAGKSTAMKALLGMLKLTSGSVEYSNKEITTMLPQNRTMLVEDALKLEATHYMWFDDDMRFPKDTILRLLEHDREIVCANYRWRNSPEKWVSYTKGKGYIPTTKKSKGLEKVTSIGFGVLMTKPSAFKKIKKFVETSEGEAFTVEYWRKGLIYETELKPLIVDVPTETGGFERIYRIGIDLSPALFSVGYIVGLNIAALVFLGGAISWFIGIPYLTDNLIFNGAKFDDATEFAFLVWDKKIRYLGVGAMVVGGIWSLVKLFKPLIEGIKASLNALKNRKLKYGLAAICIGGGEASAMIVENYDL